MKNKPFWQLAETYGIVIIFILTAIVFAIKDVRVIQPSVLLDVVLRSSWVAVGAAGMTFAICSHGMDLSVPGIMALCASLLAKLMVDGGASPTVALLVMFGVAIACGLLNGLLITKLKLQPFIATLATCLCFHGATQVYTNNRGTFIGEKLPEGLSFIGSGFLAGIPTKIYVMLIVYALLLWVYHKTAFGVKVRAIGSNETAARATGIAADNTLIAVYILTALCAALGALLYVSTMKSSSLDAGKGFDLDCITAVVLGGSALAGGRGRLTGTLIGALFVAFVKMCLNMLDVSEAGQVIVTGAVLALALAFGSLTSIAMRKEVK